MSGEDEGIELENNTYKNKGIFVISIFDEQVAGWSRYEQVEGGVSRFEY